MSQSKTKILIYTTNKQWGGSECLWFDAVPFIVSKGFDIELICHSGLLDDKQKACLKQFGKVYFGLFYPKFYRLFLKFLSKLFFFNFELDKRRHFINNSKPDFVLVNQGLNFDAFDLLEWLSHSGYRYGVISHAVDHRKYLNETIIHSLRAGFTNSMLNGFVSLANALDTSKTIGISIPNIQIFRNPVASDLYHSQFDYPDTSSAFNLAYVGRVDFEVKGQDRLLKVLSAKKWMDRPLHVSFYGSGPDQDRLLKLLESGKFANHRYLGFVRPSDIWRDNHALVLLSTYEGLPMVLVEAGLCQRMSIVSDVSGNGELIQDGVSGFIGPAHSIDEIDALLELAWERRNDWEMMGRSMHQNLKSIIPENAGAVLADTIHAKIKS